MMAEQNLTDKARALVGAGWTVERVSLYDEEGVEGWQWTDPGGVIETVAGAWDEPPPLPEVPVATGGRDTPGPWRVVFSDGEQAIKNVKANTSWEWIGTRDAAQAEADRLNARERLADAAGDMLAELWELEWKDEISVYDAHLKQERLIPCCPSCGGWEPIVAHKKFPDHRMIGHDGSCTLAAAIAKATGAVNGTAEGT